MILKDKQDREENMEKTTQNSSFNNKQGNELYLEVRPLKAGVFLFKSNKSDEVEHFINENPQVGTNGCVNEKVIFKTEASLSKEKVLTNEKEKISFTTSVSDDYLCPEIQRTFEENVEIIKEEVSQVTTTPTKSTEKKRENNENEIKLQRTTKSSTSYIEVTKRLTKDIHFKEKDDSSTDKKIDLETRARLLKEKRLKQEELRLLAEKKANEEIARILREKKLKEEEGRVLKQKRLKEIEEKLVKDKKCEEEEKARLIREKKQYEEQKAKLMKEKRFKEEQERLLKVKKAKEDEERMIKEKKIREENARLIKVKLLKEEESRLLAKKKAIEEEKIRVLKEKKQREEEKSRLSKEKKEKEVIEKARGQLKERLLEKYSSPKAQMCQ